MIDYIKIMNLPVEISDIINNPHLEFETKFNQVTAEIINKPEIAKLNGLVFILRKNQKTHKYQYVNLEGSIHKYFNNGKHNYNSFNFIDLVTVIKDISKRFKIDPYKTTLNNLEFGVNIQTPFNPNIFINSIINHKGNPFSFIIDNSICYYQCKYYRYYIKIYNKGLQYNQHNILRFEIKVVKMEQLKKIGISNLSDLYDYNKYILLGKYLLKFFKDLLIFDNRVSLNSINTKERIILLEGKNPLFWVDLKKTQPYNYFKKRNRFIELSNKHGGNNIKIVTHNLLSKKIKELSKQDNKIIQEWTGKTENNNTEMDNLPIQSIPTLFLKTKNKYLITTKKQLLNNNIN